jgi:hypothetical protein
MLNLLRSMVGTVALAGAITIGAMGFTDSSASARHGHGSSHAHSGSHGKHSFRHVGKHRLASHHRKHWHRWHHRRHYHYAWRSRSYPYGYVSSRSARYVAPSYAASTVSSTSAPGDCNCLTKEYLPDGGALFKDLCTKEQATVSDGSSSVARGPSSKRE